MKIFRFSIFVLFLIPVCCYCQPKNVKKASIIYCGIGNDVYSIFGHIGIRITSDTDDSVYNFGTFDPSTPQFISRYIKGNLDYTLSVENYDQFISPYEAEGRAVKIYPLLLTDLEVDDLETGLHNIYHSASRYYRYQFLANNCSTKVLELLESVLGKKIIPPDYNLKSTYRQSLNEILSYNPIYRFPVNCLLGSLGEEKLSIISTAYLPDSLIRTLSETKLSDATRKPLIGNPTSILQAINGLKTSNADYIAVLLILAVAIWSKSRYTFLFTSFFGIVIIFLMLYSSRQEFAYNYNLLLFNPFDLFLFFPKSHKRPILLFSILLNIIYIGVFIMLSIAYLPLILINLALIYIKLKILYSPTFSLFYYR